MSPRTTKQYEEIRESRRVLIMDTACELFANNGYFRTSISMIAEKAGISKGLIYNYFESKEELLRDLILSGLKTFHQNFDPNHDGTLTRKELEYYINEFFRRLEEDREFWKMYFAIIIQPPVLDVLETDLADIGIPMIDTLYNYFKNEGYEDPLTQMELFSATMSGIATKYVNSPENFHLDKLKVKILELYTHPNNQNSHTK